MKRIISLLLAMVLLVASTTVLATAEVTDTEYDFKTFRWGDSVATVKAVEGEPLYDTQSESPHDFWLAYETTAVGLDMIVLYCFCDDGLYEVLYISDETHSNDSLYITDYEKFEKALTKKYGEPSFDLENWENDSKKSYYADKKGDALCYGYLTYDTVWFLDRTMIIMSMSADNYEISTTIGYFSNEISPGETDYSNEI